MLTGYDVVLPVSSLSSSWINNPDLIKHVWIFEGFNKSTSRESFDAHDSILVFAELRGSVVSCGFELMEGILFENGL